MTVTQQRVGPTTKAARGMDRTYRNWSTSRRMDEAVRKVVEDDLTISESARILGVSRPRLSERVKEHREKLEELAERAKDARSSRVAAPTVAPGQEAPVVPVLEVSNETRRVPPFSEFWTRYFSHTVCPDCDRQHPLPAFHDEMMTRITDPSIKRLLINVGPYHAKSTVATTWSTIYELCRDPNSRHLIVSKGSKLANRFVYQIAKYLTDEAIYDGAAGNLIEEWGPFRGEGQWKGDQFFVAGRQDGEKDPSVSGLGVGGAIYGVRADRIIFDDIADLENQKNPERVDEMLRWATQEAATRVGRSGKLIFCGTRVSNGDIYSQLQELPGYHIFRYPCIMDEDRGLTLWPDHFDIDAAKLMRDSMSHEQWQLVYQNVDTPGIGASFTAEMLQACHDMNMHLGQVEPDWKLVMGVDPAGGGKDSGFTAMVVLGVDPVGKLHLVDLINVKQMKAPQMMQQIFDWAEQYAGQLVEVRAESNGLQSQLFQYNVELNAKLANKGIRLAPHVTTGHNKYDPQFGVESLAPQFYNQNISIPWATVGDRSRLRALEDQLLAYPMGKTSDLVMALWFASLGVKDLRSRSNLPLFDPRFKAPKRILRRRKLVDFGERTVIGYPSNGSMERGFTPPAPQKLINIA